MEARTKSAKQFLSEISTGLEALADTRGDLEGLPERSTATPQEVAFAKSAAEKVNLDAELSPDEQFALEAIIIPDKRPALDIVNDDYKRITHPDWTRWESNAGIRQRLRQVIPSVGRIELPGHPTLPYGGTGFVVGDGLLMTNRHVAEIFSSGLGVRSISFRPGHAAGIDFKQERDQPPGVLLKVVQVVMVHPYWDMALLRVEGLNAGHVPLVLSLRNPEEMIGEDIAVIGYPAFDPRNRVDVQNKVFDGVYNVKRLQPGQLRPRQRVESFGNRVFAAAHDSSTLGGNSGSAVFDVATGQVIALHFGGLYLKSNFGVPTFELARDARVINARVKFDAGASAQPIEWEDAWQRADQDEKVARAVPAAVAPAALAPVRPQRPAWVKQGRPSIGRQPEGNSASLTIPLTVNISLGIDPARSIAPLRYRMPAAPAASSGVDFIDETESVVSDYRDRGGFDPAFLGKKFVVDLPIISRDAEDILDFEIDGEPETELRYEHFSVVLSRSRRMCFLSACNIDGNLSRKSARVAWKWDPRIPKTQQIMKECYGGPPKFSRGHMTRREDPGWGTPTIAKRGNEDSMHVTNVTPQMQAFNAPIWLALEDYALQHAREDEMKITVFTGPYFADSDPEMYGVRIPVAFWKVIAFIHDETGKLCATGYEMNQEQSLQPEQEFVFGAFTSPQLGTATQVSIRSIEVRSGINFGKLVAVDPLAGDEESISDVAPRAPLLALEQIRFAR